jgi:predicted  nucleic acid-binding Zn-ribbon protein
MEDAAVVDCLLPGKLIQQGGARTYLTPGRLTRLTAIDCRSRGGEYTLGNLATGTFSLKRWLPVAEKGDAEAQYFVARIYANGMDDVPVDYAKAAEWYRKAGAQKYVAALQELGFLYEKGLGVQQDELQALNLQRQASGLGQDLDFAWKIAATREEADRMMAGLNTQLEVANSDLLDLNGKLLAVNNALVRSESERDKQEDAVANLRGQVAQFRQTVAAGDQAHVNELQRNFSKSEAELLAKEQQVVQLNAALAAYQAQLTQRVGAAQEDNARLNQILGSRNADNQNLAARLAQVELRLRLTEQELAGSRVAYDNEARKTSRLQEQLQQVTIHSGDTAALLASRQREATTLRAELDRATAEVARLGKAAASSGDSASADRAKLVALSAQVADLHARYGALQTQNERLASQSKPERTAALRELQQELDAKNASLAALTKTNQSLKGEVELQTKAMQSLQRESSAGLQAARNEASARSLEALSVRQQLSQAREQALRQQNEQAAQLLASRNELESLNEQLQSMRSVLANEGSASSLRVQELKANVSALERRNTELQSSIEKQKTQLASSSSDAYPALPVLPTLAGNATNPSNRAGAVVAAANIQRNSNGGALLDSLPRGTDYALVIGNFDYAQAAKLNTARQDAADTTEILKSRYGFEVQTLFNATAEKIVLALDKYRQTLTSADQLLIYYTGHGGTAVLPPETAFWWGVDANPKTRAGWVSGEFLRSKVEQLQAKHILIVSDSAFSSQLTKSRSVVVRTNKEDERVRIEWSRRAVTVLSSGQNTPVADGGSDSSVFSSQFVRVLRQNQALLSGNNLAAEISGRISSDAQYSGQKSLPTYGVLEQAGHANGEFYFVPKSRTTMLLAALN